jgi:catechol 2,3-dioxygenase-like lactoylglutathione lyase family enzyme
MKKAKAKKTAAKKTAASRTAKSQAAKKAAPVKGVATKKSAASRVKPAKTAAAPEAGEKLTFNHAMIYSKDVERSMRFYLDMLGFKLIEDFRYEGTPVYARLRAPGGEGTIALHQAGPGVSIASDGVRLYFEIHDVDGFCRKLQQKGFYIPEGPKMMPWGWRHVYINDPDGHEISLYWAGENRMQKTVMKAARQAART